LFSDKCLKKQYHAGVSGAARPPMRIQHACLGGETAEKTIELHDWDELLRNEQRGNAAIT
jgi:hypothetical protein